MAVCCRPRSLLSVPGRDSRNDHGGHLWDCGLYDGDDKTGYVFEALLHMRHCSEMNHAMLTIYRLLKKINHSQLDNVM